MRTIEAIKTNKRAMIHKCYNKSQSHFILGDLNYYVLTSKNNYNVFILYCKTLLLLLRRDTGRLGTGLGWFKGGLRCNDGSTV